MTEADPVQVQLIALRRNQILDAATTVFAEKGFHRATIKDVAKAAGIADGTIYIYFQNKTALLMGILDRLNETPEREQHFEQATQIGVETWAREYIGQRLAMLGEEGLQVFRALLPEILVNDDLRQRYAEQVIQPTYELAESYFRQWIEAGEIAPVDVPLAMRAVSAMVLGLLVQRLIGDPVLEARWNDLPEVVAEITLRGLKRSDE